MTDMFGKRMKMRADRQVRKEDEKAFQQTSLGRGRKGNLTRQARVVKSMEKHIERDARVHDGKDKLTDKLKRQACEQNKRTY